MLLRRWVHNLNVFGYWRFRLWWLVLTGLLKYFTGPLDIMALRVKRLLLNYRPVSISRPNIYFWSGLINRLLVLQYIWKWLSAEGVPNHDSFGQFIFLSSFLSWWYWLAFRSHTLQLDSAFWRFSEDHLAVPIDFVHSGLQTLQKRGVDDFVSVCVKFALQVGVRFDVSHLAA